MGKIKIGWAEESIVPDKKVSLQGQFFERISEYVESEISVTAMAVETEEDQMILMSVDVESLDASMLELAREKFRKLTTEVDAEKLIVAATHTHTSLRLQSLREAGRFSSSASILEEFMPKEKRYTKLVESDDTVMTPLEGTEFVTDKIALAAYEAWKNREEALFSNEFGRAAVGMCRRVVYDDGTAKMWGDTNTANFVSLEGGNDSGVELLYTFDKEKNLTGVVANIACPAQILEQRSFISADFWGRTKAMLRSRFGEQIYLLGIPGAAGDQCPRDLVRWVEPETPIDDPNVKRPNPVVRKADPSMYDISGCNRVGKRVANEIASVYEEISDWKDEAVLKHKVLKWDLPLRKVTMADYENAVREIRYYIDVHKEKEVFNYEDNAHLFVHAGTIRRYREQQFTEIYPVECHVIRLGDIAIVTSPFELFLDYGNRIKARSKAQQTFVVQLCCGSAGYLPTEKAEKAGHYSAYVSSGAVGHEGGDILTRNSIEEVNKMWQ